MNEDLKKSFIKEVHAAAERERAEVESDALAVGGIVEAARHSPGNAAAMREALERVVEIADREWKSFRETPAMKEMRDVCTSALSAPARQCDVGTAEEQMKRQFDTMCNTTNACPDSDWSCKECFAQWAQTPYEQKGEGDGM